jgi:hypothetical protein
VPSDRNSILYLAPWLDHSDGSGEAITSRFEGLDVSAWAPALVTTQPSPNRGMSAIERYADEVWDLPDLMPGGEFPKFLLGFIESRGVKVVHLIGSRLGFDLLPDIACLPRPPAIVAELAVGRDASAGFVRYASRRYGNLIDAFVVDDEELKAKTVAYEIPPSRIEVISPIQSNGHYENLYRRLLATKPASSRWREDDRGSRVDLDNPGHSLAGAISLPRSPLPERSVGVIVPCFRHGIFLPECIASIKAQTVSPTRIVVVDDGSDDPETIEAVSLLDRDPQVEVIRQGLNLGPSAARNRALDVLDTSYVLPIDADDKLLPDAIENMLAQIEAAPEDVGFIYPHAQHFGNRTDFVRLPAYNTWLLMGENYCPAPALFDARLFASGGVRYAEDIVVGHEDWDLILQLAGRNIHGRHADGPTFLYRRQGFSRVNAVDYGPHEFMESIERRHPQLYEDSDRIKANWAPALSLVLLDGPEPWRPSDVSGLASQTCIDFEVLAGEELMDGVRTLKSGPSEVALWLQEALDAARGRWVCILLPDARETLDRRSAVEHLLQGFIVSDRFTLALGRIAKSDRHALTQLDDNQRQLARPVGVAFERRAAIDLPEVWLSGSETAVADIITHLQTQEIMRWRSVPGGESSPPGPTPSTGKAGKLRLNFDRVVDKSEFATRDLIAHQLPRLPNLISASPRRWEEAAGWTPPGTQHLCRHISEDGQHRIIANHRYSPPGYSLEFDLGALHRDAFPGTSRLVHADHSFELIDDQNMLDEDRHALGYLEQEQLPQLEPVHLSVLPDTGQHILVAGKRDPLSEVAVPVADFGWIEPFPLNPCHRVRETAPWRAIPLVRWEEGLGLRHRYDTGDGKGGTLIGSLFPWIEDDALVSLRVRADGRLVTELAQPGRASRDPRKVAQWIAAPSGRIGPTPVRRLTFLATTHRKRRQAEDEGTMLGGLRQAGGPQLYPLFSTTHPVTADQLVTCAPREALGRGYLLDGVLGYIYSRAEREADLR